MDFKSLRKFYYSFIHIYINYPNIVWAGTFKTEGIIHIVRMHKGSGEGSIQMHAIAYKKDGGFKEKWNVKFKLRDK